MKTASMHSLRAGVALLALALTSGCATTAVVKAGSQRQTVTDRIVTVERAYAAPDGRLVLCLNAARASAETPGAYHLELPALPATPAASGPAPRRSPALHKGWPKPRAVEAQRLREVPVLRLAGPATAPGLPALVGQMTDRDAIVAFVDHSRGAFAYCARQPEAPTPALTVYGLPTRQVGPAYFAWVLLPPAVAVDAGLGAAMLPIAIPGAILLADMLETGR